jgi:hypothetical protein
MADLIDRIAGLPADGEPERPKIAVHQFIGGLRLLAEGSISAAEAVQDYDLQGAELTQAQALVNNVNGKPVALSKIIYVLKVEAVSFRVEDDEDTIYHNPDGTVDKTRVVADLEL